MIEYSIDCTLEKKNSDQIFFSFVFNHLYSIIIDIHYNIGEMRFSINGLAAYFTL